ncbi:MAG TPA: riboflavin synthase [Candidatus Akkermansia intestinavium]|nr:riboflavin synthase [Candidatus Akkermansia intestinavium]
MFTGLVECTGRVLELTPIEQGARYTLEIPFADELALGDSVAVNGCCLTVDRIECKRVEFDLLTQTLRVTSLGQLKPGSICNLERAMGGSGRFGGHFVMGHVDTTGEVVSITPVGQDHCVRVRIPSEYTRYTIDKGSIAIDGISLTIANIIDGNILEFWITPHTWQRTNMHAYAPGTIVDIEVDMIAKYVEKMFAARS